jgi:Ni/Fe-hydrogenase subunit HybB-like protein
MNLACALCFIGVFIEKGIGLVLPGFTPGTLGEVYIYFPSVVEGMILIGVAGVGLLVFTLFTKVAIPLAFLENNGSEEGASQTPGGWVHGPGTVARAPQ